MSHWLRQPVTYNVFTVVTLLAVLLLVIATGLSLVGTQSVALATLEQLARETDLVDEAMLASVRADLESRLQGVVTVVLMIFVAMLSSFAANYLGRGRHHSNLSRIRELEARLGEKL